MNLKDNWKGIVKSVAPVLGAALGGPMAGAAVKMIAEDLLGDPNATEHDVASFVTSASPDSLIKLREIDTGFAVKMKELDVDVFREEVKDRDSARVLAKVNMYPQIVLSSIYTVGYVFILYSFLAGDVSVDQSLKTEFNIVLGVLTAGMANIMQFWFGSSSGSKEKTTRLGSAQ